MRVKQSGLLITLIAIGLLFSGCFGIVPRLGEVTGSVKYEDDTPIAGAQVSLGSYHATTNEQGLFKLSKVKYGSYTLTVTLDGEVVHSEKVDVNRAAQSVHVKVPVVVPTGSVTGTVTQIGEGPVAGATVTLTPGEYTATSGADGTYGVTGVPYGTYVLNVTVDGALVYSQSVTVDDEVVVHDVAFEKTVEPVTVEGQVTRLDGKPLPGAVVQLAGKSATAGAGGTFSIGDVIPGDHLLKVILDGREVHSEMIHVDEASSGIVVEVAIGDVIGTLVFGSGTPIAGATVSLDGRTVTTDAKGQFTVENVPYGSYTVTVTPDYLELADATILVDEAEESVVLETVQTLLYQDDFRSSSIGAFPATWSIDKEDQPDLAKAFSVENGPGGLMLMAHPGEGEGRITTQPFATGAKKLLIETTFYVEQSAYDALADYRPKSEIQGPRIMLRKQGVWPPLVDFRTSILTKMGTLTGSGWELVDGGFDTDTLSTLSLLVDLVEYSVRVAVDGEWLEGELGFRNTVQGGPYQIQLYMHPEWYAESYIGPFSVYVVE